MTKTTKAPATERERFEAAMKRAADALREASNAVDEAATIIGRRGESNGVRYDIFIAGVLSGTAVEISGVATRARSMKREYAPMLS